MQVVHAAGGRRGESVESEVEGKNCGERRRFERGCDAAGQSSWEEIFLLASIPRTEANAIENEHQASPMFTYPVGHHGCAATGGAADDDPSFVVSFLVFIFVLVIVVIGGAPRHPGPDQRAVTLGCRRGFGHGS